MALLRQIFITQLKLHNASTNNTSKSSFLCPFPENNVYKFTATEATPSCNWRLAIQTLPVAFVSDKLRTDFWRSSGVEDHARSMKQRKLKKKNVCTALG